VKNNRPVAYVRSQDFEVIVAAVVVVEEEALDSDEAVELDPFPQVGRLVAVDGAHR
jgi:hypothetical protein